MAEGLAKDKYEMVYNIKWKIWHLPAATEGIHWNCLLEYTVSRPASKQKTSPGYNARALLTVMVTVNCGINFEGLIIEWPYFLNYSGSNIRYRCKAALFLVSNYYSIGGEVTVGILDGWELSVFSYHLFHPHQKSTLIHCQYRWVLPEAGLEVVIREYSYTESSRGHPVRG